MRQPLNPMTLYLEGQHLIEASAGTGKTWTIASLYLRLVLGLGGPGGHPLMPQDILVLTFTRAATRELLERIRMRLVQARDLFSGNLEPAKADGFLCDLVQAIPSGAARRQAAWRLEWAAAAMDDASVMTIDAWVQRLLMEEVWPPSQPAPQQLLESDERWIAQAVADYWRQQVYPLDDAAMQAVADVAATPQACAAWLMPALRSSHPAPPFPQNTLQQALHPMAGARAGTLARLKAGWPARCDAIESWFFLQTQANPRAFNGNLLRGGLETVRGWCHEIRTWAAGPSSWLEGVNAGAPAERRLRARLTPSGVMNLYNRAARPPDEAHLPTWAREFEDLVGQLDALPQAHEVLGLHALAWVSHELARTKLKRLAFTFDDLLAKVTQSLRQHPESAKRVRRRFPAAMVDEFQDTSPGQLALFEAVYPPHSQPTAGEADHLLLLIGDPKQSIYAFRGADIHSYLSVRRRLSQRLHALDCNRRSAAPLVAAVNALFQNAERHGGQQPPHGAFLHGRDLPFEAVRSDGPRERLVRHGVPMPVLCGWTEGLARSASEVRALNAARAANRMAELLGDPGVGFLHPDGEFRRLRPKDCCVLVRSRIEAQAMAHALRPRGLSCVYLSERESVLESPQALEVLELLQALQDPRNLALARRVWAIESMGIPLSRHLCARDDDRLWDTRIQRLQESADRWRREGVLSALRHFIRCEGIIDHALQTPAGERSLTNWLHLAEWLESLAWRHATPDALLRAYADILADTDKALQTTPGLREATLMRLESEDDVVQIVTLHKSKGLQYPVVWMPFTLHSRDESTSSLSHDWVYEDDQWHLRAHEVAQPDASSAVPGESPPVDDGLQEDLRLMYVGLTRAVYQVWLGATPRKHRDKAHQDWHQSALGHLVSGLGRKRSDQEVVDDLKVLWEHMRMAAEQASSARGDDGEPKPAVQLEVLGPEEVHVTSGLVRQHASQAPRAARGITHPASHHWRVASYSAIALGAGEHAAPWRELRWDEQAMSQDPGEGSAPQASQGAGPWHTWPSSVGFGQLLHECLETGAAWGFDLHPQGAWSAEMTVQLQASAWADQEASILGWLRQVVCQPLLPGGIRLCDLRILRAELEFWMPLHRMNTQALDALLTTHLWPGRDRPALRPQQIEGLMIGFADLVFESEGRYQVLDYKSNRLGAGPQHYTPESLCTAVLEHRYEVQAALYLLALHRLLQHRMGARYRMEDHLGSAHFLFLRGIDQADGHLLSITPDRAWLLPLDAQFAPPQSP